MLFNTDVYAPFGLEPEVNPDISLNCKELEDPATRLALTEYGAFLSIYKNDVWKKDNDSWIGFTSYRQLDKSPVIFKNKAKFSEILNIVCGGFAGWGYYYSRSNASTLSELCHPNINKFITDVLSHFGIKIPERFYTDKHLLFASYWAMNKSIFIDFMSWSWPIMQHAMTLTSHEFAHTKSPVPSVDQRKWLGYFMERIFLIWYMIRDYRPSNIGPVCGLLA